MPMARSDVRPGVVVLVPAGADPVRPAVPYKLLIAAVWDGAAPGTVRVGGHLLRLDGSPSARRHSYRDADLPLDRIDPVPARAAT